MPETIAIRRLLQQMTGERGLNLAGVEIVLGLERQVERLRAELERARKRTEELESRISTEGGS